MKGDTFALQATWAQGATTYVTSVGGAPQVYGGNMSAAFGWVTDGVFTTGSGVALTSAWGINGGYQHFWNPKWRSSLYGGYTAISYGGSATTMICPAGAATATPTGTALTGVYELLAELQLLASRFAHPVEPASGSRHRRRCRLEPLEYGVRRYRDPRGQRRASGWRLHDLGPGCGERALPHPAELPAVRRIRRGRPRLLPRDPTNTKDRQRCRSFFLWLCR